MKVEKINYSDDLVIRYYIRNGDGLYSTTGAYPRWVNFSRAKIWNNIGTLKNHLNLFGEIPSDWEIVSVIHQIKEPGLNAKKIYEEHALKRKHMEKVRMETLEKNRIKWEIDRLSRRLREIS